MKKKHYNLADKFKENKWSIKDYSQFLYNENKHNFTNSIEFVFKSASLLDNYKDIEFWLETPKDAFLFLLNEIKNNNFDIHNLALVLPDAFIMEGFEEYILDYINSRDYITEQEKKKLKKLAKMHELDLIIHELLKKEFLKERELEKKTTTKNNDKIL